MENQKEVKLTKRISAYLIDVIVVSFIFSLVTLIRFINPTYDEYIEASTKYNEVLEKYYDEEIDASKMVEENTELYYSITKYGISYSICAIVIITSYFVIFPLFTNGQTLGKKLMKIKIISNNEKKLNIGNFLLRIMPLYYLSVGSLIPLIINSILVFILNSKHYLVANAIVTYTFMFIYAISIIFILVRKDKRGLHEVISNTKVVNEEV